jgi:flagellar motor switch protein FliM
MASRNEEQGVSWNTEPAQHVPPAKERSIGPCSFRAAGRISNENARLLTEMHETFAHHLANALDGYLGAGIDVKLQSLEQLAIKDYIASIAPFSYLAAATFNTSPGTVFIHCQINLVFPIIDLLLGGTSTGDSEPRELSEIEEELMRDLMSLIARKGELAWRLPSGSLTGCQRIRSTALHHFCPPNERVTLVRFAMEILNVTGTFQLVLPTSFGNVLVNQGKLDPARKKHSLRQFPGMSIRDRVLDCDFTVASDLPPMRVPVRELVGLQPGCVLKLRAPVSTPGVLTVVDRPIFEALPVRNGLQKAAQLVRRLPAAASRKV